MDELDGALAELRRMRCGQRRCQFPFHDLLLAAIAEVASEPAADVEPVRLRELPGGAVGAGEGVSEHLSDNEVARREGIAALRGSPLTRLGLYTSGLAEELRAVLTKTTDDLPW